jgi:hypothetical protein
MATAPAGWTQTHISYDDVPYDGATVIDRLRAAVAQAA